VSDPVRIGVFGRSGFSSFLIDVEEIDRSVCGVTMNEACRSLGRTRLAATRRTPVQGSEPRPAYLPAEDPQLMAEDEDLQVLRPVGC
jgi:hypothetical protein